VVLTLYAALSAEFIIRFTVDKQVRRDRENEKGDILLRGTADKPIICMLIGLSTMLILLFIRSIYRMIELSGGWSGTVISTQWLFGSSALPFPFVGKALMIVKQTCLMVP